MSNIIADFEVTTKSGIAQGYKKNNIVYWDDIPYAKPPINELRWKAPRAMNQPQKLILPRENNFVFKDRLRLAELVEMECMLVQKIACI